MQGFAAAYRATNLEDNANFRVQRERTRVEEDLGQRVLDALGTDAVVAEMRRQGIAQADQFLERDVQRDLMLREYALKVARRAQRDGTPLLPDMDFSSEAVQQTVNDTLRREYQAAQDDLETLPPGSFLPQFGGAVVSGVADLRQAPFLILGGAAGGSAMRVIGREAAINMATEAATLPSQFAMAERLDIPDPSVSGQLAMAAAVGGIFAGVPIAAQRGLSYFRDRQSVPVTSARPAVESQAIADQVEDALATGREADIETLVEQFGPPRPPEWIERPPLVAEDTGLEGNTLRQDLERQIADLTRQVRPPKRPVANYVRSLGGIDPDGDFAAELRAIGVTNTRAPGLFRRGGRMDLDNIPSVEAEDALPGIGRLIPEENGYLARQQLIDVLGGEANGQRPDLDDMAEINRLQADLDMLDALDAIDTDLRAPRTEPEEGASGPFFPPSRVGDGRAVYGQASDWMRANGYHRLLSDAEMDEIASIVARRGGAIDDVIDQFLAREARHQIGERHGQTRGNDGAPRDALGDVREPGNRQGATDAGSDPTAVSARYAVADAATPPIYDDPLSPDARAYDEAVLTELRLADGFDDEVAELDEAEAFLAAVELCGGPRR
ncbi:MULTISPECIES: hypothetical protein [Jannaschia]|nr:MULTISPECIES: hypothetical protein [unclassified Jannaschia]